ncbi:MULTISPECIES: hypothetical protein [Bacillus]|uniref:hypothetical protein n=1 Tax=Bacillus TaxID=1386 RepID=UPI001C7FB7B1|nr:MULTISPECIES: hypothetical protein [Bacillus]BCC56650.1 hypothetical protein BCJMU07_p501 [Bacillus cereus]
MKRIDFHEIDFEKMKIVENYNYHGEEYHSYHLVFEIPKLPNTKLLTVVDVWENEWNVKRIHQLEPKITYELDDALKEKFVAALKKVLAIS